MKKILAIVLSLVMVFSMTVTASAVDFGNTDEISGSIDKVVEDANTAIDSAAGIYESFEAGDYAGALTGVFDFLSDLFKAIHTLVHTLSEFFDFNCPFCDGTVADDDAVAGDDTTTDGSEEEEAPRGEGAAIIVADGSQTTFGGGEPFYGDIYLQATVTVSAIELLEVTADVNNLVVLDEPNTVVISGGNFTLTEGGKLIIDTTDDLTTQACFVGDIYVNGELLTPENVDQYLEGVENPCFF